MKGFIRLMIIGAMVSSLLSCASQQTEEDDSLTTESYSDNGASESSSGQDDFADFDNESGSSSESAPSQQSSSSQQDPDLALEEEINQASGSNEQNFAQDDLDKQAKQEMQPQAPAEPAPQEPPPAVAQQEEPPPPAIDDTVSAPPPEEPPAPVVNNEPAPEPTMVESTPVEKSVEITGLKYKANDSGGTVIVESNGPVTYTTRVNADLKQYIVEIPNTTLPKRLKRTLNTKDIKGAVGAVDAYQSPGSNTSRIVVQMRDGYGEPVVQQEGNSLLIVTSATGEAMATTAATHVEEDGDNANDTSMSRGDTEVNVDLNSNKILASQSLEEFLSGNTKFYGRKISIETSNIDVRDALKFITEESGVNMVITDEVKGNISLKLRQVPWDQALVVIMKARKLGYSRQGNVLRIVPLDDLKKEEDDATKLALARKNIEPLKVRAFNISYAKVDELDKKIKDFLTERGKVVSDVRTSTIVVTDIEDSVNRVVKLIQGLDAAPPQVLIEGKIVEALDSFQRTVGVQWSFNGADVQIGNGANGPVNLRPNLTVGQAANTPGGLGFGINVGVLDIFGDLSASLALFEKEEKVKVLSSPRIVTLSNEKADISQTNELPVKTLTPQPNGQPIVTYQFKPLTLKLEVTPQVTGEGTVIMKVLVNRQIKGAAVSTTDDTFSVNSREANTRVIVKNGQTAVIGGIYRSDVTEGITGVPWLKDIPVLGHLFKGTSIDKQRSELLIFLTPRILAQAESSTQHSGE
ncbi:type IV pilus secretin PilQ [Bdellovibrio sp. HCB337]|uniref:type IV pilus secretin PilQ n=1 Tax=Bdellovibrio sp. HCB337 TaxID=3394358 RepID=UPI0039A45C24